MQYEEVLRNKYGQWSCYFDIKVLTINVPLFKKLRDIIFFWWENHFLSHFEGHFEGHFRGQKRRGPLKMSLEMAHKVILPPKKNYIKKFLNTQQQTITHNNSTQQHSGT